eukprot:275736-Prymnesium_polylepis.1
MMGCCAAGGGECCGRAGCHGHTRGLVGTHGLAHTRAHTRTCDCAHGRVPVPKGVCLCPRAKGVCGRPRARVDRLEGSLGVGHGEAQQGRRLVAEPEGVHKVGVRLGSALVVGSTRLGGVEDGLCARERDDGRKGRGVELYTRERTCRPRLG